MSSSSPPRRASSSASRRCSSTSWPRSTCPNPSRRLDDARVAIDALTGVVEHVGSRLGEAEPALRQALNQLQMAFVEVAGAAGSGGAGEPTPEG